MSAAATFANVTSRPRAWQWDQIFEAKSILVDWGAMCESVLENFSHKVGLSPDVLSAGFTSESPGEIIKMLRPGPQPRGSILNDLG